jgi:site-specific DNA-cytosine methylase
LFDNVLDFQQGTGYDVISQRRRQLPPADAVYLGFSCKDLSHLNKSSSSAKGCVRLSSLRTGGTLKGCVDYIKRVRPKLVYLENVAAIEDMDKTWGTSNADEVVSMVADLGYILVHKVLDARQHGAPQRRTRWWGMAVLVKTDGQPLTAQEDIAYEEQKQDVLQNLADMEMAPVSLDHVLMPEDSDELQEWQEWRHKASLDKQDDVVEGMEENDAKEVKEERWQDLHKEMFRSKGWRWPPVLELMYDLQEMAKLSTLPRRSQEIVCYHDLLKGKLSDDDVEVIMDVSQSLHRVHPVRGASPCVIPRGVLWARKRMRALEPNEALALQGLKLRTVSDVATFTRSEMLSLAGNAFCASTAMACTMATLAVFPFD